MPSYLANGNKTLAVWNKC